MILCPQCSIPKEGVCGDPKGPGEQDGGGQDLEGQNRTNRPSRADQADMCLDT